MLYNDDGLRVYNEGEYSKMTPIGMYFTGNFYKNHIFIKFIVFL